MITESDYEQYVNMLKDCDLPTLLRMNHCISNEMMRRYVIRSYFLPTPNKPNTELLKLKTFMEDFDRMLKFPKNRDTQDIDEVDLTNHVCSSNDWTNLEVKQMIKKAMTNGLIYEKRSGCFAKP